MDHKYYSEYFHFERTHWWFTARLEILERYVETQIAKGQKLRILNVGVATGATSLMLEKFGEVTNSEYDSACCSFLREELQMEVDEASLTDLPYDDASFDLVCAFDVIEHIEDDAAAMAEIRRVLRPEGHALITVPAYMFMWSRHDEINHHFRRYVDSDLREVIGRELQIEYQSYYNFSLFLPIAGFRVISKPFRKEQKDESTGSDFEIGAKDGFVNRLFFKLFRSERNFLQRKKRLPFGVSLISHARRH